MKNLHNGRLTRTGKVCLLLLVCFLVTDSGVYAWRSTDFFKNKKQVDSDNDDLIDAQLSKKEKASDDLKHKDDGGETQPAPISFSRRIERALDTARETRENAFSTVRSAGSTALGVPRRVGSAAVSVPGNVGRAVKNKAQDAGKNVVGTAQSAGRFVARVPGRAATNVRSVAGIRKKREQGVVADEKDILNLGSDADIAAIAKKKEEIAQATGAEDERYNQAVAGLKERLGLSPEDIELLERKQLFGDAQLFDMNQKQIAENKNLLADPSTSDRKRIELWNQIKGDTKTNESIGQGVKDAPKLFRNAEIDALKEEDKTEEKVTAIQEKWDRIAKLSPDYNEQMIALSKENRKNLNAIKQGAPTLQPLRPGQHDVRSTPPTDLPPLRPTIQLPPPPIPDKLPEPAFVFSAPPKDFSPSPLAPALQEASARLKASLHGQSEDVPPVPLTPPPPPTQDVVPPIPKDLPPPQPGSM